MDAYLKIKLESKRWKDITDIDIYDIVCIRNGKDIKFYNTKYFHSEHKTVSNQLDDYTHLYCFTIELFNRKDNPYFSHCDNDFFTELDDSLNGIFLQVIQQKRGKEEIKFTVKLNFVSTYSGYPDVQEGQGYFEVMEFKQLTRAERS